MSSILLFTDSSGTMIRFTNLRIIIAPTTKATAVEPIIIRSACVELLLNSLESQITSAVQSVPATCVA